MNGSNTTSGTCAGGAILPVYGLVEITPQGNDTLIWKSQEPQPYTFRKLGPNQYQFKGPSGLGLGEQIMTVTFNNEKALRMVHQLVPSKDPACTHTFNYTGEYRWDRP